MSADPRVDRDNRESVSHSDGQKRTTYVCEHTVENPHNSGHVPGTINVIGEVACTAWMYQIRVIVHLQKQACLFGLCVWDLVAFTNPPATGNSYVWANAATSCSPGHYRGRINTWVTWPDGVTTYFYWIGNSEHLTC